MHDNDKPRPKPQWGRRLLRSLVPLTSLSMIVPASLLLAPTAAEASSAASAVFSGGTGTVSTGGTLYAKQGATVTLTVNTSSDTQCVDVAGAFTGHQQSDTAKSTWTFATTAPAGNGAQAITATASVKFNNNNVCSGASGSAQGSYTLDNTPPVLAAKQSPSANAAGWTNADTTITWSATDSGGSGVASVTPTTYSQTSDTAGVTKSATATDQVGNTATSSVSLKVDKTVPTVTGTRSPAANVNGWNNTDVTVSFKSDDALSGIKTAAPGTTTLSKDGADQSVTGTATDNADNSSSAKVGSINIDKAPPSLTGSPTTSANGDGWYRGDVKIHWTGEDALSGVDPTSLPADSTISGEGTGLTATASISDKAGNTTNATSAAVNIDRTPPTTGITGTSNDWTNGDVNVTLTPSDSRSGVASTSYAVDGGAAKTGTSFTLSTEGDHTVTFFSTDKAGNVEATRTAHVKIDKTAPTIGHAFTPLTYTAGAWTNQDVTVTFTCEDQGGSGVGSCTDPVKVTGEGAMQQVVGTAKDGAGNSATDTAFVSMDKTPPTIGTSLDRPGNANGWYNDDVTVGFTANDILSGLASTSPAKVLGEGANQSASGIATDVAGNSANASVTGINVDKTAPTLTGTPSATGWSNGDVTVHWTATDKLSGLDGSVPSDSTVTGEGDNLSASATVSDKAGNTTNTTVSGIKIDRAVPTTSVALPAPLDSGWYRGAVQVTLNGVDTLSGVSKTYFTVDGGAAQAYTGPFSFDSKGTHTLTYWSVDKAGNVEDNTGANNTKTIKIDGNPPTTKVINPISPDSGWFVTSGIPVAFSASDPESGIAATYYTIDGGARQTYGDGFTQTLSDGTHTIAYWSVDNAGNEEAHETTNVTTVSVDTTPPTITGATVNTDGTLRAANANGWFNSDVKVKFTCSDATPGSGLQTGVAGCAGDTTVTNESATQTVPGDAIDVAGNKTHVDFGPVKLDETAPTLSGAATTNPNAAGWYKGDVKVHWTGQDGLSGIDASTQPADSTVIGEGGNLGTSASISDNAGNVGKGSVTGIKIDRTAPSISGATVNDDGTLRSANGAGWLNSAVRVRFTATDSLSGVQDKPSDVVLSSDGANQSAKGSANDLADNTSSATVTGINIDSKAPQTTANNKCDGANGWCKGNSATVTLTAVDQAGLSGVKEIHYSVNGGPEKVAAGSTTDVSVPLAAKSGLATVDYWAVDNAGNVEGKNTASLKFDNIAPTVTHTVNPAANAAGWNNASTTVHFDAKDDDGGSGVDITSVTPDVTVSSETAASGQAVTGTAKDLAGNTGTDLVTVKLDKSAPTISGAITAGTKGANGYYTGPVTVHFTCGDSLSGFATCPADVVLNGDGDNQSVTGKAVDKAGNDASATVSGINIDSMAPAISVSGVSSNAIYTLGAMPSASCSATDSGSGVDANGCKVTVTGGNASGVGTFNWSASATDKAGNVTTQTGTYKVTYRFDGFLQHINDTAHQIDQAVSIFKGGSTVPAKFQLKKADGTVVQGGSAQWLIPAKGSATAATVDESVYSDPATSGSSYKYDATAQQWIYNWSTKGSTLGYYYRVGVSLDDGQTYYVNLGLR